MKQTDFGFILILFYIYGGLGRCQPLHFFLVNCRLHYSSRPIFRRNCKNMILALLFWCLAIVIFCFQVTKALRNQFIIEKYEEFCESITKIYEKVKHFN